MILTDFPAVGIGSAAYLPGFADYRAVSPGLVNYDPAPHNVRLKTLGATEANALLTWDGGGGNVAIFVDGKLVQRSSGNQAIISLPSAGESHLVQVLPALSDSDDLPRPDLELLPPIRARISWVRPTSSGPGLLSAIREYRVYWDAGTGSVDFSRTLTTVPDHGGWGFAILTPELKDNTTYKFVVRAVDRAGNEEQTVTTKTIKLRTMPQGVKTLDYTYDHTTKEITLSWT